MGAWGQERRVPRCPGVRACRSQGLPSAGLGQVALSGRDQARLLDSCHGSRASGVLAACRRCARAPVERVTGQGCTPVWGHGVPARCSHTSSHAGCPRLCFSLCRFLLGCSSAAGLLPSVWEAAFILSTDGGETTDFVRVSDQFLSRSQSPKGRAFSRVAGPHVARTFLNRVQFAAHRTVAELPASLQPSLTWDVRNRIVNSYFFFCF